MSNSRPDNDLAARLVSLETLLTHLQRNVHELDQVVAEQGRAMNDLGKKIRRVAAELATLQDATVEEPDEEEGPLL